MRQGLTLWRKAPGQTRMSPLDIFLQADPLATEPCGRLQSDELGLSRTSNVNSGLCKRLSLKHHNIEAGRQRPYSGQCQRLRAARCPLGKRAE